MFSVISTGICCRPLCTAIVSPIISGTTIERRDQVLMGLRSLRADAACTFFARCRSTNGPFLSERGISAPLSCDAERSYCPYVCCDGFSCPWFASPTVKPDADYPGPTCLRRRRADGRQDS